MNFPLRGIFVVTFAWSIMQVKHGLNIVALFMYFVGCKYI